ncbi:unnamed protein product [Allacma fusca]|uniref:Uncharacterized protein n=1 Tax=Allacma fusca TaxID=39272 RepID=A0A8J2JRE3_9HEXA|nr:unnamed protein product [Allacma fusca]
MHSCPVTLGFDTHLVPWPGIKYACVRVLELYCKVFNQQELYELIVRKTCNSCKCPKDSHDLFHDEWINIRDRLGLASNNTDPIQRLSSLRPPPLHQGFSWAPPNLTPNQVGEYYKEYPPDKVPKSGSPGEIYRDRQILHQIPKQDLALAYCKHVEKEHHSAYEDFVNARNEVALDVGFVAPVVIPASECPTCGDVIRVGQLGVFAPKFGHNLAWHPQCFRCNFCNEFLVDLTYCNYNDALFCERHYAEQLRPRCAACDEVSVNFFKIFFSSLHFPARKF